MKPIADRIDRHSGSNAPSVGTGRRFPLIDCNYQAFSLDRSYGGSDDRQPQSFRNISRDYFQREARRNFLAEIAFFLVLAAVLVGAFVEGARVIIHVLQLSPA